MKAHGTSYLVQRLYNLSNLTYDAALYNARWMMTKRRTMLNGDCVRSHDYTGYTTVSLLQSVCPAVQFCAVLLCHAVRTKLVGMAPRANVDLFDYAKHRRRVEGSGSPRPSTKPRPALLIGLRGR